MTIINYCKKTQYNRDESPPPYIQPLPDNVMNSSARRSARIKALQQTISPHKPLFPTPSTGYSSKILHNKSLRKRRDSERLKFKLHNYGLIQEKPWIGRSNPNLIQPLYNINVC
eukprot:963543_1